MDDRRSLIKYGTVLVGIAAVLAGYLWVNRVQEFQGTLRDCRTDVVPAVIGWPHAPARLITPGATYALEFDDYKKWRQFVEQANGQQVVVRGVLRKWRGKYQRRHLRIRVRDMQQVPPTAATIPASSPGSGRAGAAPMCATASSKSSGST